MTPVDVESVPSRPRRPRRVLLGLAAGAVALAGLTACSADGGSMSGAQPAVGPAIVDGGVAPEGTVQLDAAEDSARDVIQTGDLTLAVDAPIATSAEVTRIVEEAGGRIDSLQEVAADRYQAESAYVTVRIPSDELTATLDELKTLGETVSVSLSAQDVTTARQDLDARIEALRGSVDRLLELLASAQNTTDLIAIESELATRQAELDGLVAQRDSLLDAVDYSSVYVSLVSAEGEPTGTPTDFWSGVAAGWNGLVGFLGGLLVAAGVLVPWLIPLAVIGAVIWIIVAAARRRRRSRPAPGPWGHPGHPGQPPVPSAPSAPTNAAAEPLVPVPAGGPAPEAGADTGVSPSDGDPSRTA